MQRYYKLRPSRSLTFLLCFLCAAALASLWLTPVPVLLTYAITLAVFIGAGYSLLRLASLRASTSCVAFRLDDAADIVLVLRNGQHVAGRLSPDCLVTPYLVILVVALNERRSTRSVLVMPDAMSEESFRHLRVTLRWGAQAEQAQS